MGPPPNPNRRRRNADAITGTARERCPECGTPRSADAVCTMCGTPPSASDAGAPGPRSATPGAAPELPTPKRWVIATRDWWSAWCASVQVTVFQPSEWETLKALLPLVDAMHREKDPLKRMKLFEAIHKTERALGGTHMERLRGRLDVSAGDGGPAVGVGQGGEAPEGVAVLDEYREMLG